MARSREDAQQVINLFFAKYPFLDMFQFKVMKKLNTEQYAEMLRECIVLAFIDEKAGYPAPPVEAVAAGVPVIAPYGRGMSHLSKQEGIVWLPSNDNFLLVEELAGFCLDWLEKIPEEIQEKTVLENFTPDVVRGRLLGVMTELQDHKIKMFAAVKQAVSEGKLDDKQFDLE